MPVPGDTIIAPSQPAWNRTYSACLINAPQAIVWQVLTDFGAYDDWNTFTYDVDMPAFAVGEIFSFKVRMSDIFIRNQQEYICEIDPPHRVAWRYPFEGNFVLAAVRYQMLTSVSDNQTRYQTWETFNGLAAPLLKLTVLGMVQNGFDRCAHDLKQHCESIYR